MTLWHRHSRWLLGSVLAGSLLVAPVSHATNTEDVVQASDSLAGNYLAARIAATDRNTRAAATFYRQVLKLDPDNEELQLRAFLTFIGNGDFDEGVALGETLTTYDTTPEMVSIVLAVDRMRSKNWPGAVKQLDKDWESALDRLVAGLAEGWAHFGAGDTDEALLTIDGLNGPSWFDLFVQYHGGLIALAAGDAIDAARRLDVAYNNRGGAQASAATYSRVVNAYALALAGAGRRPEALEIVNRVLDDQPQNPVFLELQTALNGAGPLPKSIANARRGAAEMFLNVASALNRDGGENFALIYMQLARQLAPKDELVTASLADLLDRQGVLDEANTLFDSLPDGSIYAPIARLEKALNLDELGEEDEARAIFERLMSERPDDMVVSMSYGAVLSRHERYDEAAKVYQAAVDRLPQLEPIHWNLVYRLGISYERTKQWDKAEPMFRKALELNPDQPSVLNYLGYSLVDMDVKVPEALDMIRRAVAQRPNDGYMVDSLGWAYYKLKRFSEAVVELERAVELRPGDPTINDHLGDAYWRANRKLEAIFQWRHALALDPDDANIPEITRKLNDGMKPLPKPGEREALTPDQPTDDDKEG